MSLRNPLDFPVPTRQELVEMLDKDGQDITLGDPMAPGAVSEVYSGQLGERAIVVKFTSDKLADSMPAGYLPHQTHYVDTAILRYLSASPVRVPEVFDTFDDQPLTVMEDLEGAGFASLDNELEQGHVPTADAAESTGHGIGLIQEALGKNEEIQPALPRPDVSDIAHQPAWTLSARERVRLRFASDNLQLTWVDANPSNIFVSPDGEAAFIDFGFSNKVDRDFTLGCCLSYVAISALTDQIPKVAAADFIARAAGAYREILPIDDEVLTTYLASEIATNSEGDWISGLGYSQKQKLLLFGQRIFGEKLFSLSAVTALLQRVH